jgi:hypothetical protein
MLTWLKKRLTGKAEQPPGPRVTLEARPVRSRLVKWDDTAEGVVLHVPLQPPGGRRPLLFAAPLSKTITLDEIGSDIWRQCDGEHTLGDLLAHMRQRWQFSYKEAEMGLTNYLKTLAARGVVVVAAK